MWIPIYLQPLWPRTMSDAMHLGEPYLFMLARTWARCSRSRLWPNQPARQWPYQSGRTAACFDEDRARCFVPSRDETEGYVEQAQGWFPTADGEPWGYAPHDLGLRAERYVAQSKGRFSAANGKKWGHALPELGARAECYVAQAKGRFPPAD